MKKSLFFAMPVYRDVSAFTVQSLITLTASQLCRQEFGMKMKMHVGECPIGRARNDLTAEFLKTDCTHILFVDSDIVFSYEQVKKILFDDKPIVGGCYCKKQDGNPSIVCNTLTDADAPDENGLMRIKFAGTGFVCIAREVFESIIAKLGDKIEYLDDRDCKTVKHDFWQMGVLQDRQLGVKRWMSEDWYFCDIAHQCGFETWLDCKILLNHCGLAMYPLKTQLPDLYTPEQMQRMNLPMASDTAVMTRREVMAEFHK